MRLRCEAAGLEKPEAYSLKFVEDFFMAENEAGWSQIVRRSRTVNVGEAPKKESWN